MIKSLNKLGMKETYLNIIKPTCDEPTANITLSGERLKAFSGAAPEARGFRQSCLAAAP